MPYLPAVELEWPKGLTVTASVIWLHGLGADGNDFAPIVPQLNLPAGDIIVQLLKSSEEG